MRINVHDFSGHPFQVQLSRELAARGHHVEHVYSAQYVTGHGRLTVEADDPDGFRVTPIVTDVPFDKYRPRARLHFETSYARETLRFKAQRRFDVTIMCNLPLLSQAMVERKLNQNDQPWLFWHQDIYSHGITDELRRRVPGASAHLGRLVARVERRQVRRADHVVAIADTFVDKYRQWGLPTGHVSVIPNWASLDDIRPRERDNPWAKSHRLPEQGLRLLYSGTLGRKHNPLLLLNLLDALRALGVDASLTVCSEGAGADDLRRAAGGRVDVRVLGFQPVEDFAEVLASADVVVTLLEPDASQFSVPSKVLSYLAGGRPLVGLMPFGNPAGVDIVNSGGFVRQPDDDGVRTMAQWIRDTAGQPGALDAIGDQARRYAEARFDITTIGDRFEGLLHGILARRRSAVREAVGR